MVISFPGEISTKCSFKAKIDSISDALSDFQNEDIENRSSMSTISNSSRDILQSVWKNSM